MRLTSMVVSSRPHLHDPPGRADRHVREPRRHRHRRSRQQPHRQPGLLPGLPPRGLSRALITFHMPAARHPALQSRMPHQRGPPQAAGVPAEDERTRRGLLDHHYSPGSPRFHRECSTPPSGTSATERSVAIRRKTPAMDIAWKGMLTCDYERSRPHASQLERELYTRSLTTWPSVFLGEPTPLRNPAQTRHRRYQARRPRPADRAASCLPRQPAPRTRPRRASPAHRRQASAALRRAETRPASGCLDRSPWTASVAAASTAILPVMSAHIVNWLLPEEQWETRMTKLLGNRACQHVPASPRSASPPAPATCSPGSPPKQRRPPAGNHLLTAQRSAVETRDSWIDGRDPRRRRRRSSA